MPLAVGWLPAQKVQTCHGLTPSPRVSDSAIPTDCLSQRHFVVFSSALRRKVFFSCSSPSSYQASFAKTCQGDTLTKLQVSFFFYRHNLQLVVGSGNNNKYGNGNNSMPKVQ